MDITNLPREPIAILIIGVAIYNIVAANIEFAPFWNSRQVRRLSIIFPKIVIRVLFTLIGFLALGVAIAVLLGYGE